MELPIHFSAATVKGSGRGKGLGSPTINLDLSAVPQELTDGVYACCVSALGKRYKGALHLGPRPVFKDSRSCEVHILDETIADAPVSLDIEILAYIRAISDFPSPEALKLQIAKDITEIRKHLA